MSKRETVARVSTSSSSALGQNPFGGLIATGLPEAELPTATPKVDTSPTTQKSRGRVDIKRVKAGRGGKTVTLVSGFVGIGATEKNALCKTLRQACGCGGTVNTGGAIEIQGDQRERLAALLREARFTPVFAGG